MAKPIDYSKDGYEPAPWTDYSPHLILLSSLVVSVVLRLSGIVTWSWWFALSPLWLLMTTYAGSFVAAMATRDS